MTEQQSTPGSDHPTIEDHKKAILKTFEELQEAKRKIDEDLKTLRATLKTLEKHTKK